MTGLMASPRSPAAMAAAALARLYVCLSLFLSRLYTSQLRRLYTAKLSPGPSYNDTNVYMTTETWWHHTQRWPSPPTPTPPARPSDASASRARVIWFVLRSLSCSGSARRSLFVLMYSWIVGCVKQPLKFLWNTSSIDCEPGKSHPLHLTNRHAAYRKKY